MRREERVTVQGPVKEQQPDGMSHRGMDPSRKGALGKGGGGGLREDTGGWYMHRYNCMHISKSGRALDGIQAAWVEPPTD